MSRFAAIERACQAHFETEVEAVLGLPTAYENVAQFTPPASGPWASVQVRFADRDSSCIGGTTRPRNIGSVEAQVFTPFDEGANAGREIADAICAAFDQARLVGDPTTVLVIFKIGAGRPINGNADAGYWQTNVTCPFYSDEES